MNVTPLAGTHQKDLIARATALLTDGLGQEVTLQLWGDLASEGIISTLRAGVESVNAVHDSTGAKTGPVAKPTVFEFSQLHPEYSFSCEALVLNARNGTVKTLAPNSSEAVPVASAVLAAARASLSCPSSLWGSRQGLKGPAHTDSAETAPKKTSKDAFAGKEGADLDLARRFASVAEFINADGFSGVGCLSGVVVRKVHAPCLSEPACSNNFSGASCDDASSAPLVASSGVSPLILYLGDPDEPRASPRTGCSVEVEGVLRVVVDGGALEDLLGGIPLQLLALSKDGDGFGISAQVAGIVRSLVDGLEVGGEQGERVDVTLSCLAPADANGQLIPGGSQCRLTNLHPSAVDFL